MVTSKSGSDYFLVEVTKNANGTGKYFVSVQHPDMDGFNDRVIGDFFTKKEISEMIGHLIEAIDYDCGY